jgi:hypothetical protein
MSQIKFGLTILRPCQALLCVSYVPPAPCRSSSRVKPRRAADKLCQEGKKREKKKRQGAIPELLDIISLWNNKERREQEKETRNLLRAGLPLA